jgi:hypothetical protein
MEIELPLHRPSMEIELTLHSPTMEIELALHSPSMEIELALQSQSMENSGRPLQSIVTMFSSSSRQGLLGIKHVSQPHCYTSAILLN